MYSSRIVNTLGCILCGKGERTIFPVEIAPNEAVKKDVEENSKEKDTPVYAQVCIEQFKAQFKENMKTKDKRYAEYEFKAAGGKEEGAIVKIINPDMFALAYCPDVLKSDVNPKPVKKPDNKKDPPKKPDNKKDPPKKPDNKKDPPKKPDNNKDPPKKPDNKKDPPKKDIPKKNSDEED